jgi:hypothetical protein
MLDPSVRNVCGVDPKQLRPVDRTSTPSRSGPEPPGAHSSRSASPHRRRVRSLDDLHVRNSYRSWVAQRCVANLVGPSCWIPAMYCVAAGQWCDHILQVTECGVKVPVSVLLRPCSYQLVVYAPSHRYQGLIHSTATGRALREANQMPGSNQARNHTDRVVITPSTRPPGRRQRCDRPSYGGSGPSPVPLARQHS